YLWSNGSATATNTNLSAGTYTVTLSDANGCSSTNSAILTEPTALSASISSSTNVGCNGGSTGSATVGASGGTAPYTYLWSNAGTTTTNANLSAGTYTVTLSDANGCSSTSSAILTEPTALSASISSTTNVSCNGGGNGSATVATSGGTAPYSYLWSNGDTTATNTNLSAGTYTVTLSDANGCSSTSSAIITEPVALVTTVTTVNFTLTADLTGASYRWLDCNNNNMAIAGEISQSFNAISNGSYAVELTLNGCVDTSSCILILNVGVNDFNAEKASLLLYPNPNKGVFTFEVRGEEGIHEQVQIFSLSGNLIKEINLLKSKVLIDASMMADGIYILRYKEQALKFIINK
ncbi:MAG: T9SS type A sorting domain-containing protein, partial [Flavobacteriales bacterium]|nr:T9SS type A sorting domain-containing protein [Flavobacteriales bacterium]